MIRIFLRCFGLLACLLLTACSASHDSNIDRLEQIKAYGNENPKEALVMLDSLELEIRDASEYTRYKYDLLRVRLSDKADILPSSDIMIRRLMAYFGEKGTNAEKQEVYYYAGSTYRDLQDTPRALEYFFRSLDYATDFPGECDQIMLRNTYSNLNYLYYMVKDYPDALEMGIRELESCRLTHTDVVRPFVHIGTLYHVMDSLELAEIALDSAYTHIVQSGHISQYQESLVFLLYQYSYMDKIERARECAMLIDRNPLVDFEANTCMAFAWYYELLGKNDSACIYFKRVLDDGTDVDNMYDAARHMFSIYYDAGDSRNANMYADKYMQLSSSLDFGKRQELAATVNNLYQYHLDQKKEQKLRDEKERYKTFLLLLASCSMLFLCTGYICYIKWKKKRLRKEARLSSELQRVTKNEKELTACVKKKEAELQVARRSLEHSTKEMNRLQQELNCVSGKVKEYNAALERKEQELLEKLEQNKTFIRLLHQSELEGKAEDVVDAIKKSSVGKMEMGTADWRQLYEAVDELYPTFKDRLVKEFGDFTEQQMQVCYLMRIGLTKHQIQNITGLARVTIWRWTKKYSWVTN